MNTQKIIFGIGAIIIISLGAYFLPPAVRDMRSVENKSPSHKTFEETTYLGLAYQFQYPSSMSIFAPGRTLNFVTISDNEVESENPKFVCGNDNPEPDELYVEVTISSNADRKGASTPVSEVSKRYESFQEVSGFNGKIIRGAEGAGNHCGGSDEFIWKYENGYVVFSVSPSNTERVNDYKTIIETFKFE
jgi:hypothetical protein